MNPSAAKQDLDALEASLEKYLCFDQTHRDWWKKFLVELHQEFNRPQISVEGKSWLLPEIQSILKQSDRIQETSTSLPAKLLERHTNSIKEIPEVNDALTPH